MRQRVSDKTQRRVKQQLHDPYAFTDDEYSKEPTFRAGGLVTAMGMLQLLTALALLGFLFGGALLFCIMVLTALGLVLLHHSEPSGLKQGMGLQQAVNRLYALRRNALDYSLTLSIAQSQKYQQSRKELQNVVLPVSPTLQKVVATMALKSNETVQTPQKKLTPLATMNVAHLKTNTSPTVSSHTMETTENLFEEKPRAQSIPKQVMCSRPLLPLKLMRLQQENSMVETMAYKREATNMQQTEEHAKPQQMQKESMPKAAIKMKPPIALSKSESKVKPVADIKLVEVAPPTTTVVVGPSAPFVAQVSVYPKLKPVVEVANGEPPMERDLVFTRKVLLYSSDLVMNMAEQESENHPEKETESEPKTESVDSVVSLISSPPLIPTTVKQTLTNAVEPNFLLDIQLEPISKPEKKSVSVGSVHHNQVDNVDLRMMLEELNAMQSELDAAMACCTSLLNGDEEKADLATEQQV